ncbi:SusC/RagA family TonB-linked outer membrane protein [Betaproteobacteria bacterium]|nr:SusC/RagA family TonB-linked outer membrane protein [Betaproteobacteria bacterium]
MRISVFLSLLCIFQLYAENTYSQKSEIRLTFKKTLLEQVLYKIETQTGYTFIYTDKTIDTNRQVDLNIVANDIDEVLNALFSGTNVLYRVVDKQIVLSRTPRPISNEANQSKRITGVVTDANKEPIIGVNVVEKGTTNGVITDYDGKYTLEAKEGAILQFSYIGYLTKEVSVNKLTSLNVQLIEDTQALEEVVVVGYGTQRKVNLTGAISTVDTKQLENRPITNSTQVLQGVQGVYVNQAGAQPGVDGATIRIRGQGTLNNNDPLVLVDGIEYKLDAINPNDIESISVLKDAASAAIYGSRAANGVILVKTKDGKKGAFTTDYNNYFGFQRATYLPKFVYDPILFMESRNQAQLNEGKLVPDYPQAVIDEYREGMKTDPIIYPQNNWLDIMYNDAFIMEHNLRFSGGDDKYSYSVSLGYGSQEGVLRGTDSEKYTIGVNTSAQINSRLKIGMNLHGHYQIYNEPASGVPNLVEMSYKAQAFYPTYLKDGRYADTFIRTPGHNIYRHPLALADEGENNHKGQRLLANLSAEYKLPFNIVYNLHAGLSKYDYLRTRFAPDIYEYQVKTEVPVRVVYDGVNTRHVRKDDNNNLDKTLFNTLDWEQSFTEAHKVKLLLGYSYEDFFVSNFYGQREGYLGNELHELNAGSNNPTVGGTSSKSVLMSYFGRANYGYKDRYLLEANFRYDGSSRFAKDHRWGIFPSFSAGWRLSEESFMKNLTWLDNLKLRVSWGQLGNERIDLFRYVDLMALGLNYPFNGTVSSGTAVTAYNDPNITWETTTMSNVGIDALLFSGKIDFSFELFNKRTTNILREVLLPDQVGGLAGPIQNIGTVDNKGFELGLRFKNKLSGLGYEIFGNLTYLKNEIVDLKGQTIINGMFILKEGYPIDSYYMLHADGIFQSQDEINNSPTQTAATKPGYLKFADTNKDGKVTEEDRQIRGSVIPKFTYTFGLNLTYQQFDLNALFQGVSDVYTYGDQIGATPLWFGCGLPEAWVTDAWTPERGTSAKLPILTTYEGSLNENFRTNDFWLRDASYLRLKNVQLTYTFPQQLMRKTEAIKNLRVFVNAQNLFTLSKMKDFDPEKNLKGSNWYAYPSVKTFTAGLNITF